MGLVQVLAATVAPLRFATDRLNIRYFTDATQDAVEVTAATVDDLRAGSAPYSTAAAGSRRLTLATESLHSNTDWLAEDVGKAASEYVHPMPGRSDAHTGERALHHCGSPGGVAV